MSGGPGRRRCGTAVSPSGSTCGWTSATGAHSEGKHGPQGRRPWLPLDRPSITGPGEDAFSTPENRTGSASGRRVPAQRDGGYVVVLRLIRDCGDDVAQGPAQVGIHEGEQGGREPRAPFVDVFAASLDESVGEHQDGVTGAESQAV